MPDKKINELPAESTMATPEDQKLVFIGDPITGQLYQGPKPAGGGGGTLSRFGIEDNLGVQDRSVDMQQKALGINNLTLVSIQTRVPGATSTDDIFYGFYSDNNYSNMYASS